MSLVHCRRHMADHLSDEERERYARHLVLPLVGESGQARLLESSVLVVGAGGLGSPALLYLAAAGVGKIGIIDHDSVDISNLQRQVIHVSSEIGEAKAESASRRLYELNGDGQFLPIVERLTETNALSIISEYDVVIDGTDNFESRYLIGDACEILGKPWVFGSVHRFEGQVSTFNHDGGPNYRDLFPAPPPPELAPTCADAGLLGVLPGLVGTIQATEALKIILDIGDSLNGKLLAIDSLTMITRVLTFNRNPERATVTALAGDAMQMKSISPLDFVSKKNSGWTPFLLDVRSEREEAIASLDATDLRITHTSVPERISEIPSDRDIVVYCRTGGRSAAVVRFLVQSGWGQERVLNLDGGIHLWSDTVDSDIVKY